MNEYVYATDMEVDVLDRAVEFASRHFGVKKQSLLNDKGLTHMAVQFFWANYFDSGNEL